MRKHSASNDHSDCQLLNSAALFTAIEHHFLSAIIHSVKNIGVFIEGTCYINNRNCVTDASVSVHC